MKWYEKLKIKWKARTKMKVSKERLTQIVTEELKEAGGLKTYLDKDTGKLKSRDPAEAEYQRGMDAVGQIGAIIERNQERLHRAGISDPTDAPLLQDLELILKLVEAFENGQEIPRVMDSGRIGGFQTGEQ